MKIYRTYQDVEVKNYITTTTSPKLMKRKLQHYAMVDWPNGKPCCLVNEWLHHVAKTTTGNTVGTYAAQISFIVRFCYHRKIDFFSLTDDAIYEFKATLVDEVTNNDRKRRNNNTTRNIIQRTLGFLVWAQRNTINSLPCNFILIGEASTYPAITIQFRTNPKTGHRYFEHDSMPPESVPESDKLPIADSVISMLENEVSSICRSGHNPNEIITNYLYERRLFCIWMLKRFGMRPNELILCSITQNTNIFATKELLLPTMKRRLDKPVLRMLKVSTSDALRFGRYITERKNFIQYFDSEYETDALLLTPQLKPLKLCSLTKEFYRIKTAAGLNGHRVCMSMFRHRFITREVITALKEFMSTTGTTRDMMTESATFAILKRVATKTGHANPDSLWAYVAIAWASMDIWDSIDRAIEALQVADEILQDLNELYHNLSRTRFDTLQEASDFVQSILKEFIKRGLIHCSN